MTFWGLYIPIEILWVLGVIYSVLVLSSICFRIVDRVQPSTTITELRIRTKSWWFIATGVSVLITAPMVIGVVLIAYLSFVALREMFSIGRFREADRTALFIAYFAIPVQYYLAYNNYYEQFLAFIPLVMFITIPLILVFKGQTENIGRSMSIIPTVLLLTVYMISHMAMLFHIKIEGFTAGPGGLIIFLIFLTSFNDVFQFTWGKLLGKRKILPKISPNKTWAGFIGGVATTALLGYLLHFLTPLSGFQAAITGLILGVMGFFGDSLVSAIKRDLGIKDTDDLIPGHGGALDRMDSIILTTPVFYHLLRHFIEVS